MKLNENQKALVNKINHYEYTVEYLEKYYRENPSTIPLASLNYSLSVVNVKCCNAFMCAVNGMLKAESLIID